FIDEIHTIIGAGAASGGVMDASNLLKPLLSSGKLRCIGSTTYAEYRGIFDKDKALSRRFQKVDVLEPSVEDAYKILKGLKSRFEEHHGLRYTDKALRTATEMAARFITDRFLPDKAIDVIDEAGAYQQLQPVSKRKKVVGPSDIEAVIAKIARIPPKTVTSDDKELLEKLESNLSLVVFGQNKAVSQLVSAIKLARAGLRSGDKPIGSFLLAGPTGVGKTEVTKQLAMQLGLELLRFDMSEYMERHTVSRLIGAPPGYVGYDQGGLLTDAVTKHPHSVVLLDEIEKAHPEVFNLLLQVMDHGTLTDNNGRKADFRNVIVVMTTNAGAESISKRSIGFSVQDNSTDAMEAINKLFTPEFRNRLDAVVPFEPLSQEVILTVVDKFLTALQTQLDEKQVQLQVDDAAREWLVEEGYDRNMGARPMERVIQEHIKKPLADMVLFGALSKGGIAKVTVDAKGEGLSVEAVTEKAEEAVPA
ncbi:MAG: AAA family ATPase, partial [Luminiphilus sp.]